MDAPTTAFHVPLFSELVGRYCFTKQPFDTARAVRAIYEDAQRTHQSRVGETLDCNSCNNDNCWCGADEDPDTDPDERHTVQCAHCGISCQCNHVHDAEYIRDSCDGGDYWDFYLNDFVVSEGLLCCDCQSYQARVVNLNQRADPSGQYPHSIPCIDDYDEPPRRPNSDGSVPLDLWSRIAAECIAAGYQKPPPNESTGNYDDNRLLRALATFIPESDRDSWFDRQFETAVAKAHRFLDADDRESGKRTRHERDEDNTETEPKHKRVAASLVQDK